MIAPARTTAYYTLRAVSSGRSDLPSALPKRRTHRADERLRTHRQDSAPGTRRWQRRRVYLVEHFARRRLSKIDGEVRIVVELSLYQLLHLDRVPAAAVVDVAVDLARAARKPSATGFVNGILRSVLRERRN